MQTKKLGRKKAVDTRDKNYPIKAVLPKKVPIVNAKYWDANEWWGDQGDSPKCVGFAWAHWIEDGPITHSGTPPIVSPHTIYSEAQKIDEWPGENYDGTSVRAGAKYLQRAGKVESYLWGWDLKTLVEAVLTKGPVVVGTYWYTQMFYPDRTGKIKIGGRIAGGHAYVINGVDTRRRMFRIKNSWGTNWGDNGHAYISFSDMDRLIRNAGEVCLAVEKQF